MCDRADEIVELLTEIRDLLYGFATEDDYETVSTIPDDRAE